MSIKGQKLSKPQEDTLRSLPRSLWEDYKPIKKLVAFGLASKVEGSGGLSHPQYVRTPAGEDWVTSNPLPTCTP